jgi:hypothetical protein
MRHECGIYDSFTMARRGDTNPNQRVQDAATSPLAEAVGFLYEVGAAAVEGAEIGVQVGTLRGSWAALWRLRRMRRSGRSAEGAHSDKRKTFCPFNADRPASQKLKSGGISIQPFRALMTRVLDLQVPSLIKSINSRIASSTYRLADETTLAKLFGCGSNLSAGSLRIRSMRSF